MDAWSARSPRAFFGRAPAGRVRCIQVEKGVEQPAPCVALATDASEAAIVAAGESGAGAAADVALPIAAPRLAATRALRAAPARAPSPPARTDSPAAPARGPPLA